MFDTTLFAAAWIHPVLQIVSKAARNTVPSDLRVKTLTIPEPVYGWTGKIIDRQIADFGSKGKATFCPLRVFK